jgi:regulatory protein
MYPKKNINAPQIISYDRVKSYMQWLIQRYGDYSASALLHKANIVFKEDKQYNQAALDYLIERKIVDDQRYAQRITESLLEKNIGPNKIKEKLYTKGFSAQLIDNCITNITFNDDDYFIKALTLKKRKFGNTPITDIKLKQKALRHLIAKGFSYTIANKVINHCNDDYD